MLQPSSFARPPPGSASLWGSAGLRGSDSVMLHKRLTYRISRIAGQLGGYAVRAGKKLLVIDTENTIPFRASWLIVTEKDQVVSPIMIGQEEIFPTEDNKRFSCGNYYQQ